MRLWLAVTLATFVGSVAGAQPRLPSDATSVLHEHGAAFVEAINDTSVARRREFLRRSHAQETLTRVPEEKLLGQLARLHTDYAPLEYHHSDIVGSSLHVFARRRGTLQWHDFQFRVEAAPPYGLQGLLFIAETAEPVYLPNGAIDSPETLEWLNGYIDKLVRENDLAGCVLLAKGDRVLYERYFGHRDVGGSEPVTPKTRFSLGSGNKMFTALLILSLVEQGKLQLEQPIGAFFPDFPDADLARQITIRQLLAHSSGLGDYLTDEYEKNGWSSTRIVDVVPFVYSDFRAHGPHFAPGTQHRYSNSGFLLLGRILEQVSGKDYFDLVREKLYVPLGLRETDHYLTDGSVPDLATALAKAAGPKAASKATTAGTSGASKWIEARRGLRGTSAGGGFSTPRDILRFGSALVGGRIVSHETLARMTTAQPPEDPEGELYGLGFLLEKSAAGASSFGHGGIASGVNFEFRFFPDENLTLIAFCNQDNGAYDDLRKNIVKLITGDR